ncbi:unnamed protein product [Withania somnifera]
MTSIATKHALLAISLSLPFSLCLSTKSYTRKIAKGIFGVFAVYGEEGGILDKKDPRTTVPQYEGKFLDVSQALEVARYDIQYCDWRARQVVLTIMHLHEKVSESDCSSSSASMSTGGLDTIKKFLVPVAFSADLKDDTMLPIDCFEQPWVIFRGNDGKPGCVHSTCAHRACPLHLSSLNEGCIQCPYHGWAYSTDGKCEKMPYTRLLNIKIKALPSTLPSLLPPSGFQIHAEIVMELPVEHGLRLDNLLDLEFRPPCMVSSTIGISKPGKLEGQSTKQCFPLLHQLHVCLPASRQKTRLLYRMSLDFPPLLKHIPFMRYAWRHFPEQVLNEDLWLVLGQQDRMLNGVDIWNLPVSYDKLGVRYRIWRDTVDSGAKQLPFSK